MPRRTRDLPVGVGLGVRSGEQAAEVAGFADGVIVGSAFVSQGRRDGGRPVSASWPRSWPTGVRRPLVAR